MSDIITAMEVAIDQLRKEKVSEQSLVYAAALVVGQALAESWLNPRATHDEYTGFGIYGARGERMYAMLQWLHENAYPDHSLEGQMRYMIHELMTQKQYLPSQQALLTANAENLELGSFTLTVNFERPTVNNFQTRLRYTNQALSDYKETINI